MAEQKTPAQTFAIGTEPNDELTQGFVNLDDVEPNDEVGLAGVTPGEPTPDSYGLRPNMGQLQGAAAFYNIAALETAVTPENVEDMLLDLRPPAQVDRILNGLRSEDADVRTLTARNMLSDPRIPVQDKLAAIALLQNDSGRFDVNAVQRQVGYNLAQFDYMSDDYEDDDLALEVAQDEAEALPTNVQAFDAAYGSDEEQQEDVYAQLDALYQQSDQNMSTLDFVESITPVGSLPTLNKTIDRIWSDIGETDAGLRVGNYVGVGTRMKQLREYYRAADDNEKRRVAGIVLRNLKSNTGLFQDSNDLVVMQVMDNLFSKELRGTDEFAFETQTLEQRRARLDRAAERATDPDLVPGSPEHLEALAELTEAQNAWAGGGQQLFDDAMNALDLVGVGSVIKGTLTLGRKGIPAAWRRIFRTSQRNASETVANAVTNPQAGEALGIDAKQAIEQGIPNTTGAIERGTNVFDALVERQQQAIATAKRQMWPVNMTADERTAALAELTNEVGLMAKKALPKRHINMTSIVERPDGSGVDIEAIFGATSQKGYASLRSARNASKAAVEEVFGADTPVEIVRHNPSTNQFEVVDDALPGRTKGEFFLRAKDSRSYNSARETYGALNLGDDSVADLTFGSAVSQWTRGINIFDNITQSWISSRTRAAQSANALGAGLLKPIADLPFADKQFLAGIIRKYEGKKVLTDAELAAEGADEKVTAAYRAFRAIDDAMYELADFALRNQYMREGLRDVRVAGTRAGWAKPAEKFQASSWGDQLVFDPETGQTVKMSAGDIGRLYDSGGQLGTLKFPIENASGNVNRILLSGKNTRVLPIPQRGVLPRITGHYPHITKGNFVVYGVTKSGTRQALRMAATMSDAQGWIDGVGAKLISRGKKNKNSKWASFEAKYDKSLEHPEMWGEKLDEVFTNNGGILFGQRSGLKLGNISKDFGAIDVDPIQSLLDGWRVATSAVTKNELVGNMRQRLYNYLQQHDNLFVDPTTPVQNLSLRNVNLEHANKKAVDTAAAYARQIELMARSPDFYRDVSRNVYKRLSYTAYRAGEKIRPLKPVTRKAEQVFANAAKFGKNPVSMAMSYMHAAYISLMAPKQFVLQALQSLYAAGLSPTAYVKGLRQFTAISGGVMGAMRTLHGGKSVMPRDALIQMSKEVAGTFGMKPNEMVDLVDTIVESGLLDAVQHNTMIKDAIGDAAERAMTKSASSTEQTFGAVGRGVDTMAGIVAAPVRYGSRIGFQLGENVNQIMTFLTLYNADKAKGIANLSSHLYKDNLIGRVSELTGNMVDTAAPAYTRSFLKPFFQWVQFQHKMVLMTLPKSVGGSSQFTNLEKARMAAVQMALYGTHATAITAVAHTAIERGIVERLEAEDQQNAFVQWWRSPEAKTAFDGFVFDYTMNKALQSIFGETDKEWNEFSWGKAFAPGAGSDFLADKLIGLASMDWREAGGVMAKQASKFVNFFDRAAQVAQAQWQGLDDVPVERRIAQLTQQGLTASLPIYDKALAYAWAVRHDEAVNQGGKMGEGFANELESYLGLVLGVNTKEKESYYAAMDRLGGQYANEGGLPVKKLADEYWKHLVAQSTKWDREAATDELYDAMFVQHYNEQALLLSALSPREKEELNEIISRKLEAVYAGEEGDVTETAFVRRITKQLSAGGFGDEGPQLAAYLSNQPFVKNHPERLALVLSAWEDLAEEPRAENITTGEAGN